MRIVGAQTLRRWGKFALPATSALLNALRDKDEKVRAAVADALVAIGKPAVSGLCEALTDKDAAVRALAARCLGDLEDAARDAVPSLILALRDSDQSVRDNVKRALRYIGTDSVP